MRDSSAFGRSSGLVRKAGILMASAIAIVAMLAIPVSSASAAPVTYTFDHGKTDFGILKGVPILPAPANVAGIPNPDVNAVLTGDATSNGAGTTSLNFAPGDVVFPWMSVANPFDPANPIPVKFNAIAAVTGSVIEATGETTMSMPLALTVLVGGTPMAPELCNVAPVRLDLSTNPSNTPYPGTPFSGGLGVNGALVASWTSLPPGVPAGAAGPGACDLLNSAITSKGGIWFSNGLTEPVFPPPPPPPPVTTSPTLKMTVKPKSKKVKPGKKVTFTATVRNNGDGAAASTKVCVKPPAKKFVKVKKCVKLGKVNAGAAKKAKFKVTVKKGKKAAKKGKVLKFKFTATATDAKTVKANTKIKVK